jgi:hypothetical protein
LLSTASEPVFHQANSPVAQLARGAAKSHAALFLAGEPPDWKQHAGFTVISAQHALDRSRMLSVYAEAATLLVRGCAAPSLMFRR